ncbi:SRPBCC family protein [Acidicapsa dinghuensis]|uniref:SRPBCC family protein n=1 Tax=Acidicapsa dinghuensis TaxID=2218256 RepID=A0ABW1EL13_9BACT|nr:SRPBCC family protein [Acidicapsa dinghuensis]
MRHTFSSEQWVPFPVELVFAFFANPANLPHLLPAWQRARVESSRLIAPPTRPVATDPALRFQSPAAGVGSEIVLSFRLMRGLFLRSRWLARITEFIWMSHFCDEQLSGPFAYWHHRHGITREVRESIDGTLVTDDVEYEPPMGPLGEFAHNSYIRPQLATLFAHRRKRLEEILPIAAAQSVRRR